MLILFVWKYDWSMIMCWLPFILQEVMCIVCHTKVIVGALIFVMIFTIKSGGYLM
jgi:hypothetical protein